MYDFDNCKLVSADELQREAMLQTRTGKPELAMLDRVLSGAKFRSTPLPQICELDAEGLIMLALENDEQRTAPKAPVKKDLFNRELTHPYIKVGISNDKMASKITVLKPPENMPEPTVQDIIDFMNQKGIVYGIKTNIIENIVRLHLYGSTLTAAVGTPAQDGVDGCINRRFHGDSLPALPHNGSEEIDYTDLSWFEQVNEGDVLCDITPATDGVDGVNVLGEAISAYCGTPVEIPAGLNTAVSPDSKSLLAACDGQVVFRRGKVSVLKLITLDNVDGSTGNILHSGSLIVNGDVTGDCTLRIGGDIIVRGSITGGTLISGSSVVCTAGINGGGAETSIQAANCIRSTFIENCTITAGQNIYADAIMNTDINCEGSIYLSGNSGCYVGGVCKLCGEMRLNELGNDAGIETVINLNGTKDLIKEKERAVQLCEKYQACLDTVFTVATGISKRVAAEPAQMPILVRLIYLKRRLLDEIQNLTKLSQTISEDIYNSPNGMIIVYKALYPNVTLDINGAYYKNDMEKTSCSIKKRRGNINFGLAETR